MSLSEIAKNHPELEQLDLQSFGKWGDTGFEIDQRVVDDILAFPNLKRLDCSFSGSSDHVLSFKLPNLPNLEHVGGDLLNLDSDGLYQFLEAAPNLKSISLDTQAHGNGMIIIGECILIDMLTKYGNKLKKVDFADKHLSKGI